jgi:hypothetical protein
MLAADTDPADHLVRHPDDLAGMTVRARRAVALWLIVACDGLARGLAPPRSRACLLVRP